MNEQLYDKLRVKLGNTNIEGMTYIEKSRQDGLYFDIHYRGQKVAEIWDKELYGMIFTNYVTEEEKANAIELAPRGSDKYRFASDGARVFNYHSGYRQKYNIAFSSLDDSILRLRNVITLAGGGQPITYNVFRSFYEWNTLLTDLCTNTEYEAMINGGSEGGEGIAIVRKGTTSPQRICVYPKKTKGPGFVLEMDIYEKLKERCSLPEPDRIKSNRPHYNNLSENMIIDVCKFFIQSMRINPSESNHNSQPREQIIPPYNDNRYIFFRMIDAQKNICLVKDRNGKTYVQKAYQSYNIAVFERLKEANITGIPQVIEFVEYRDTLYVIEEYIRGKDFNQIFEDTGCLDEVEISRICEFLLPIVSELHQMTPPMIHRDIKPANIMLSNTGKIYLIDFNAAKEYNFSANEDTVLAGSRYFAAPEQLMGYGQSDARTDVFGIGTTMNYLMTGMAYHQMIAPGRFESIWKKCTKMDKESRFQSIEELQEALHEAMINRLC